MTIKTISSSLLLASLSACLIGPLGPQVVPTQRAEGFSLTMLRDHRVAVWPIPTARLDESTARTVASEYGTSARFLDALGDRFSERVGAACKQKSLRSREVLAILTRDEATRSLLDPDRTLGVADPNNRFAAAPAPDLERLADLPDLAGIQYSLLVRDVEMGREVVSGSGPTFIPSQQGFGTTVAATHAGVGTWVGGSSGSASSSARLRVAVVDLRARKVVWDGAIYSSASSMVFLGSALHDVEADLVTNFLVEMGIPPPKPAGRPY